jgi:hypothetical protein
MAASALVRPRVRSFEVFGLRRAYHQSYRGDDNAVITRFGWHVQDDPELADSAQAQFTAAAYCRKSGPYHAIELYRTSDIANARDCDFLMARTTVSR